LDVNDQPVLLTERKDGVLWLVLNRPASANALNSPLQDALVRGLCAAGQDPGVRAVVLAATGDRVFSAGADLKEFVELGEDAMKRRRRAVLLRTLLAFIDFAKPMVVAIQGKALGAGCFLAWLADEVIAAHEAELGLPEIRYDMPSPVGVTLAVARSGRVGAHRLVQLGAPLSASQARELRLVDIVCDKAGLAREAQSRAATLGRIAGDAYAVNKRWLNAGLRVALQEAFAEAERIQQPQFPPPLREHSDGGE
jgi:enoyl-CoA hydratase/carnithine racemase